MAEREAIASAVAKKETLRANAFIIVVKTRFEKFVDSVCFDLPGVDNADGRAAESSRELPSVLLERVYNFKSFLRALGRSLTAWQPDECASTTGKIFEISSTIQAYSPVENKIKFSRIQRDNEGHFR